MIKRTGEYESWAKMKSRCNNKNNPDYHHYGGRGISVCERWNKFSNFLEDMGERPEGFSIDRIENDKGYFKENCRWADKYQQRANKRAKGVHYNGYSFIAQIQRNGKKYMIGIFKTQELATLAYETCRWVVDGRY